MAITPSDIEKKTFSTALRGYDLDEVDDFLDEMVVAVRELQEELTRAKERVAQLEGDPDAVAAAAALAAASVPPASVAAEPGPDESAVGRALVAAQQAADRMLEDARSEADKIVGDARTEADTFAEERDQRRIEVDAEMTEMTGLVAGVRTQLAVLATTVADKLDEMDAVVAGAHSRDAIYIADDDGEGASADPESPDFASPDLDSADDRNPIDSPEQSADEIEPDAVLGGEDDGLEVDVSDTGESEVAEQAGSAEIEGVNIFEEGEET